MTEHPSRKVPLHVHAARGVRADPRLWRLDPQRGELLGGVLACRLPLAGSHAAVIGGLAGRLRDGPVGERARLVVRPLLRLGADDLWRPPLVLVALAATTTSATLLAGRFTRGRPVRAAPVVPAEGALLVVEFCTDARLASARLAGYARAGVREVWELDLAESWTVAYRSPWGGSYRSRSLWYPGEEVPLSSLPGVSVCALPASSSSSTKTSPATSTVSP